MKTYGSHTIYKRPNRATPYDYASRTSTEWDFSVVVNDDKTRELLLERASALAASGDIEYLLIGGVEQQPNSAVKEAQSKHIHGGVIFSKPVSRSTVVQRLVSECEGVYCTPRNPRYLYITWKIHHCKEETKVDPTELLLFEFGKLPSDNEHSLWRSSRFIQNFLRKNTVPDSIVNVARLRARLDASRLRHRAELKLQGIDLSELSD